MSTGGKKIAVIGAGPAGYTAAQELSKNGIPSIFMTKRIDLAGLFTRVFPSTVCPRSFWTKFLRL